MDLLKELKKIPTEERHLPLYHFSVNDLSLIRSISSEIMSFYDKDKTKKYQAIFLRYQHSNLFNEQKESSMTVQEVIELLEITMSKEVMDIRFVYLPFYNFNSSLDCFVKKEEKKGVVGYVVK